MGFLPFFPSFQRRCEVIFRIGELVYKLYHDAAPDNSSFYIEKAVDKTAPLCYVVGYNTAEGHK